MKHATVPRDGFVVPLIGIPEAATVEQCDLCGEDIPLRQSIFTGSQILCPRCAENKAADL